MPPRKTLSRTRLFHPGLSLMIAIAGFATAMLVGIAIAKSFTLKVEKNAKVTNQRGVTKHESIVISHGFAVYTLSGDSKSHPKCTSSMCLGFWPPVTVSSANKLSKASGIKGKLAVWHHKGFNQVLLGGHPLYTFSGDNGNGAATGEGIVSFGGTWHVWKVSATKASGSGVPGSGSGTPGSGSTSSTTSSSNPTSSSTTSHWG